MSTETMVSTAGIYWTLADDFSQWCGDRAEGAVPTGKEKKMGQVGSVTLVSPEPTAGVAPTPALIEQVTCPSLVEEATGNSPDAAALQSSGSSLFSIRPSPKGGMGAFALSDIPCSTVIMRELALFLATDGNGHLAEELGKLSSEERAEFRKLACYDLLDKDKDIAIFKTNRFRTGSSCGIFLIASRFNHACNPIITYYYDYNQRQLIFSTKRDVKEGEELTIMYTPNSKDLSMDYGFLCDCGVCDPPLKVPVYYDRWADKVPNETDDW
ncbi:hypothetical protein V495_08664 [Pseudogymnoascus sp. VKM F-4514 (FW-929)]|nr:hypothetical protein V495_08664 [Pseudogymnoascus sp. VKM F-4514 (FW-929)]KFY61140.1 hypothetical protein V497_03086 [Pseudogymnoascus sp. VKM F-4516 (FW-969)]